MNVRFCIVFKVFIKVRYSCTSFVVDRSAIRLLSIVSNDCHSPSITVTRPNHSKSPFLHIFFNMYSFAWCSKPWWYT